MTCPTPKRTIATGWAAVLILLLAFGLRVWRLSSQSFWWDESYSAMVASGSLRSIVATLAREDFHPPLHYFILHYWMRVAGQSEFALRYVSVTLGVLTVAAAWITATRLLSPSAAPIATLIFAFSPFLWYYSQEARMFALVPLFGTLTVYFCARAIDESRLRWWIAYVAVTALGFYSLYYALFMPFVCGLWILLLGRRGWRAFRAWVIATVAALAIYVPWVPIFLYRNAVWSSAFQPENGPSKVVAWSWPEFVMGLPNLALYRESLALAFLGMTALVAIGSLIFAGIEARRRPGVLLAALSFVAPLAVIAAISVVKPVFHPRYAIPVAPGLYLSFAALLEYLLYAAPASAPWTRLWRRPAAIGSGALLACCAAYGLYHLEFDPAYLRDNYRGAIAYVLQREQPADTVLDNAIPPFWYYYHGPIPASYFPTGPYTEANVANELNELTRGRTRLWYVQQMAIPNDPDGFVDTQLRLHSRRLDERWFGAIRVQLWQISPEDHFAATTFSPASANLADELSLVGYAASGEATGGKTLDVELKWLVRRPPSADDGFWVGVSDAEGHSWGRADIQPRDATYSLSHSWQTGETVVTRFDLPIDVGTPPGHYQIVGGVYRLSDLAGLNVLDAGDHPIGQQFVVGTLTVSKPGVGATDPSLPNQLNVVLTKGLSLAADQIGTVTLAPGDKLPVTLLWRATGPLPALRANLEVRSSNGQILARDDGPVGGAYPSDRWQTGEIVREQRALHLPASAAAGSATLTLTLSSGQSLTLGTLKINRITHDFNPPSTPHPLQVTLGNSISLVGYELSSARAQPGDQVTLTLDWKDVRPTSTSYHVFVHLLDASNHIQAQWDGVPKNWTYPTSAWVPGEYVVDQYPLKISPQSPSGPLTLEVGLYDATTGKRLSVVGAPEGSGDDRVVLESVQVQK